ncbi:non-ribosomal peptide synthetase [Corynebacterium freneyi]|uniref:non-ribosomal peptide synthetase n=1 Tax=Corynebacterium freneyi TaxID=134034 RepID=UPI001CCF3926|nr:non-ribosomal peptide synthetase [Corynebacterium freneyi]UBI03209.1 amino acid adenylation domain-containing protein [Corynebacterium freneyi]
MIDLETLRGILAEELGVSPADIGAGDDLVNLGLDSLGVIGISEELRRRGCGVHYSALVLEPTPEAWLRIIGESAAAEGGADPSGGMTVPGGADEDDGEPFPMAPMQHAYWVGRRDDLGLGGVAAHLYVEFDGGGIDAAALERAARALIDLHPMLRTRALGDGRQRVLPASPGPALTIDDATCLPEEEIERRLREKREAKSHQKLDVDAGEVIDLTLTLLPGDRHRLHVDVDMFACDAMSYRTLLDDLMRIYRSELAHGTEPADGDDDRTVPERPGVTYREYRLAMADSGGPDPEDARYWETRVPELPPPPALPFVEEARRADPRRSIRLEHRVGALDAARFGDAAHAAGVTPAMVLATLFTEVIARWSTQRRFLLNVPLFAREQVHPDIGGVVGDFTNSVIVGVDAGPGASFLDRVRALSREVHLAASHSTVTGLDVLRSLGAHRAEPVMASVVFTSGLDLGEVFSSRVRDIAGDPVHILSQGPQVDIDAQVVELDGGLLVNWDVRRDCLPEGVIGDMFGAFTRLLDAVARDVPDWNRPLSVPLPPAQASRRAAIARDSADGGAAIGRRTLHREFLRRAEEAPERVAAVSADGAVSYGELADGAAALAAELRRRGVRSGDVVAVSLPRGVGQITAILAVLMAGAAYLPIGVGQPGPRRDAILRSGGARHVIADPARIGELPPEVAVVDPAAVPDGAADGVDAGAGPEDLAYVLFTSGSTGEPKGVEVAHGAAAHTIDAIASRFGCGPEDRTIALSAFDFDLSVLDLMLPLSVGGAVVLVGEESTRDAAEWARLIREHSVTVVNAAPGLVGMLHDIASDDELAGVRLILTGGDRVPPSLGRALSRRVPGLRFIAMGGATEAAIHSTREEVGPDYPDDFASVPYGLPLDGVQLKVVNERGEECPDHVIGEVWIGGAAVARGYRGMPELTALKFIRSGSVDWYRTGDLGRVLPDGRVEFIGRADGQLKIRGYRVELGEVEAALESLPGVSGAAATGADGAIVAAIVPAPDAGRVPTGAEARAALAGIVPEYMIPDAIAVIEELPVTANGKKDRAAVSALVDRGPRGVAEPPDGPVESAVAYLFGALTGAGGCSAADDFFDVGGNSILATTLTARIRELLDAAAFSVADVFEARTVRGIAARVSESGRSPGDVAAMAAMLMEFADGGEDAR